MLAHLPAHVLLPARNWFVVVTRRLEPNFPTEKSGTHAVIETIEIAKGTEFAFVIDHRGKVGHVHRDVGTELYLLAITVKQASYLRFRPALILSEKDRGKPARMLHPHAAVAEGAERSANRSRSEVSCM